MRGHRPGHQAPFCQRSIFRALPAPCLLHARTLARRLRPLRCAGERGSTSGVSQEWNVRPIDVPEDRPEASTSSRCTDGGDDEEFLVMEEFSGRAMAAAPLAALSLKEIGQSCRNFYDRVYFGSGEFLPIVGTMRMSYARLIQLLGEKKIKRIFIMADGQVAIIEAPFETHASDYKKEVKYDKNDRSAVYLDQKPEWQMEKMRYYCELPGNIWEDGTFMKLVKRNQYHHTEKGRVKYEWLLREHQVTTELVVMDPNDSLVFLNDQMSQLVPIIGLFFLRGFVGFGDWLVGKFFKREKDDMAKLAEEYARPRAVEFNVGDGPLRNDTGIRFEDVAGIDKVKSDIIEVIKMMRGDKKYETMGAKCPRGILLEGPPGTGKTYLAKAMAGEGGMPFYSCNGAEFVEMFSGVAAARIRNMFKTARSKAPSIIFIDEIDAIGKRRGMAGDAGASEREAGLMQLLVEMDGIVRQDQVVVIGATNRISLLDPALLRPGRFDRIVYMGRPSESNRLKILKVHAKDKPIPHNAVSERYEEDAILRETARITLGYSGADLANLLNEAAILSVREANIRDEEQTPVINMAHVREAMEKARVGLPQQKIPDSKAKKFLATVQAGKAVALALTPGIPEVQAVSIRPQGNTLGRILFEPTEYGIQGDMWHSLGYPGGEANAVELEKPVHTFELCTGLMIPLFAGRVTEKVMFGPESVTLGTAKEVAKAGDLAYYLVAQSDFHPAFRHIPVKLRMQMGSQGDTTLKGTAEWFERHTSHIQEVAFNRTCRLIEERRPVIEKLSELLCSREDETVRGPEIVRLLKETPLAEPQTIPRSHDFTSLWQERPNGANGNGSLVEIDNSKNRVQSASEAFVTFNSGEGSVGGFWLERKGSPNEEEESFALATEHLRIAAEAVIGDVNILEYLTNDTARLQVEQVKKASENSAVVSRLKSVRKYSTELDSEFPPPPLVPNDDYTGTAHDLVKSDEIDPQEMKEDFEYWTSPNSRRWS